MEEENMNTDPQEKQGEENEVIGDGENPEEKTFTQEDVNKIVKQRLERARNDLKEKQGKELAEKQKELEQRENKLNCMEYIQVNGYPKEFLEAIDTSDVEEFKKKADMLCNAGVGSRPEPPLANLESFGIGINKAFEKQPHIPKAY